MHIYTCINVYIFLKTLEGPIRWRMGWPHVAGRGGPRHTRAPKRAALFCRFHCGDDPTSSVMGNPQSVCVCV